MRLEAGIVVGAAVFLSSTSWAQDLKGLPDGNAEPPEGSEASWELALSQAPLLEAANELEEFLHAVRPLASPDPRPVGFSTIELDVESRALLLYWKSSEPVPSGVSDKLSMLRERGIDVGVKGCAFSASELDAATADLLDMLMNSNAREVFVSLGPTPAGSGLTLTVLEANQAVTELVSQANSALESVSANGKGSYISLEIVAHRPEMLSRDHDWPPYWAGSRISFPGSPPAGCSTGFAVGSLFGRYLLTAEHCMAGVPYPLIPFAYNGGLPIGYAEGPSEELDTARIVVSNSWGRIFDGPLGGEFSKPVVGRSSNFVGTMLCTSGAYSGVRCNIKISFLQQVIRNDRWHVVRDLVKAVELNFASAAGKGDSGGPVFSLSSDPAKVIAHGTVTAGEVGDFPAPCTGIINSNGVPRQCSSIIYFTEIKYAFTGREAATEVSDG